MDSRIYLNDGWRFNTCFNEEMLNGLLKDYKEVRIPHSVIETPYNYFDESIYQMVSAYQLTLFADLSWSNKSLLLTFEGVGHKSEVYLNGKLLKTHNCGYTAFTVDLSNDLIIGKDNIILVKVDSNENLNLPPFGNVIDYMTYGGIYREVYLDIKEKAHIKDVFPKISLKENGIILDCEVTLSIENNLKYRQELYDLNDNLIHRFDDMVLHHEIENVLLWDIDNPNLYNLKTILYDENNVYDIRVDRIGFRTVQFRKDGFYLNGKRVIIRGLNRHQAYPYVGYAMPKSMQVDDAKVLKYTLGLNAVRTSHYPQSKHFINACDELGLLVFTEIPGWQYIGNLDCQEVAINNTKDMILQYRNHPSIMIWGVRINESGDLDSFYEATNKVAHELDPTRQTTGVRCFLQSSLLEDVYSYNDFSHDGTNPGVRLKKLVTPNVDKPYLITEYGGHMFPTKMFDQEDRRVEHFMRHAKVMNGYYGLDGCSGGIGWCMTDYNTHKDFGSGDRICYHGVLDMYRNKKFVASLYQSQVDYEDVLEISSTMDIGEHNACIIKDIYALTNADYVNLYKDTKFIKAFYPKNSPYPNIPHAPILIDDIIGDLLISEEGFSAKKARDIKKIILSINKNGVTNIPFKTKLLMFKCMVLYGMKYSLPFSLQAKYITDWGGTVTTYRFEAVKDGKVVKTVLRQPVKKLDFNVELSHDKLIEENTYDVAAVRVKAVDENNNQLNVFNEGLTLEALGPVEIIGPKVMTLRGGTGGTYIRTIGEAGNAKLRLYLHDKLVKEIDFEVIK